MRLHRLLCRPAIAFCGFPTVSCALHKRHELSAAASVSEISYVDYYAPIIERKLDPNQFRVASGLGAALLQSAARHKRGQAANPKNPGAPRNTSSG
jgi:hypothetical protein